MELVSSDLLKSQWGIAFSNSYRLRLEKQSRFPRRVYIGDYQGPGSGPVRHAYVVAEIREWVAARVAERGGKAA
jgi:predicted DNA-binding transcriptional regulator AlpA